MVGGGRAGRDCDATDCDSFVNYKGFDQDAEAQQAVQGYVDAGYLKAYETANQATMDLGGTPVLSRFGVLCKVKDGVTKRRVILDAKQSGITAHTRPTYRVELPRATDVVNSVLSTAQLVQPENVELLVCDFAEAFWQVPLAPEER
eukprot:2255381-Amphidinium_carterae.1